MRRNRTMNVEVVYFSSRQAVLFERNSKKEDIWGKTTQDFTLIRLMNVFCTFICVLHTKKTEETVRSIN